MKFSARAVMLVAFFASLCIAWCGAGVANASPLLAPPPASEALSQAPAPDGTIRSIAQKEVKQSVRASSREELQFGTGVLVGSTPEVGTMNVLRPVNPDGTVVAYAPATDSLSPWDAPSRKLDKGTLSAVDLERINTLLADGKTVLLVDAYGGKSPQYAGVLNGVRIANGIEAYRRLYPEAPAWCYGFSGGGIDCARVAGYRHSRDINLVVDSGPTDLTGFLANPAVQNGLGYDAGAGVITSLPATDQLVIFGAMRPSGVVVYKTLRLASDILPVPQLTTGVMTFGGVFLPLPYYALLKPESLSDPEVQRVLHELSPQVRAGGYDATIVERCNASDAFVPCDVHARPFAAEAGAPVITNHGQAAPGHAMMDTEQLLAIINGGVPSSDTSTYNAPLSPVDKLTNAAVIGGMWAIGQYGQWLTEQAPPALDELDRRVVQADQAIDQATAQAVPVIDSVDNGVAQAQAEAAAVATGVATAAQQGQQLLNTVATPQSEATTTNSETVTAAAEEWLPPQVASAVNDAVQSAPVQHALNTAPVTLPQLPTREQVASLVPHGINIPGVSPGA